MSDDYRGQVVQQAADFGITFNRERCKFGVKQIEFYGYKFTKDGLKPTPKKVRAVKECERPKLKESNGFLNFMLYFILGNNPTVCHDIKHLPRVLFF